MRDPTDRTGDHPKTSRPDDASSQRQQMAVPVDNLIRTELYQSQQRFVFVNRDNLNDLRELDDDERQFVSFGDALMWGGVFLGGEKLFEAATATTFTQWPLVGLCAISALVGFFLRKHGRKLADRRSAKIDRMFDDTKKINEQNYIAVPQEGTRQRQSGNVS